MAKNLTVPVLRIEEFMHGEPLKVYGETLIPMSADSIKVLGSDPWYDEGDSFFVQWWEGYNQDAIVDVYVVSADNLEEHGNGFSIGSPETQAEYDELVAKLAEGQWQWILELMGDWEIDEIAEAAGVEVRK